MTAPALRMTPQRQAVLDVLLASHDHPTATEVYDRVRRVHPGIGAATVYRTLALLVDSGDALELSLGEGSSARYDGNVMRHDHVVCDGCGRAVDVVTPPLTRTVRALSRDTGFDISGYDLQFRGRCPDCSTTTTDPQP
jgi:Fur family ferric uptake transcriptional regulator/Fur family peroxide stress response transcriptional regulator